MFRALIAFALASTTLTSAFAQNQNPQGGILVDAKGVIRKAKHGKTVSKKALLAAAAERLSGDLNQSSELRMVSLTRLEATIAELLEGGQPLPDDIKYLAGLERIDYIIVLEDTKEIVIAGPAGGFAANSNGVMISVISGRPVLRLDDLLQALQSNSGEIVCSFDPRTENLAQVQTYLRSVGDAASVADAKARYKKMVQILGNQDVRISGVDPTSHFAKTIVEADYEMKRIAVGLQRPKVRGMKSYLALKEAGTHTMRRWWLAPKYDSLERSEDRTVWKIGGQRVQLKAQDELVDNQGNRRDAGQKQTSTSTFQKLFTDKYEELAKRFDVFARLQNSFDLAIVAALLRDEGLSASVDWKMTTFRDRDAISIDQFPVPREVPSVSNSRTAGKYVVVGVVSGGVKCAPRTELRALKAVVSPRLESVRRRAEETRRDGWWWDAKE